MIETLNLLGFDTIPKPIISRIQSLSLIITTIYNSNIPPLSCNGREEYDCDWIWSLPSSIFSASSSIASLMDGLLPRRCVHLLLAREWHRRYCWHIRLTRVVIDIKVVNHVIAKVDEAHIVEGAKKLHNNVGGAIVVEEASCICERMPFLVSCICQMTSLGHLAYIRGCHNRSLIYVRARTCLMSVLNM